MMSVMKTIEISLPCIVFLSVSKSWDLATQDALGSKTRAGSALAGFDAGATHILRRRGRVLLGRRRPPGEKGGAGRQGPRTGS